MFPNRSQARIAKSARPLMLTSSAKIGLMVVDQKIGERSFWEIYVCRNTVNGCLYALKVELVASNRKILQLNPSLLLRK
jgi:hypothetical protein